MLLEKTQIVQYRRKEQDTFGNDAVSNSTSAFGSVIDESCSNGILGTKESDSVESSICTVSLSKARCELADSVIILLRCFVCASW